jgi:hypothetical protein
MNFRAASARFKRNWVALLCCACDGHLSLTEPPEAERVLKMALDDPMLQTDPLYAVTVFHALSHLAKMPVSLAPFLPIGIILNENILRILENCQQSDALIACLDFVRRILCSQSVSVGRFRIYSKLLSQGCTAKPKLQRLITAVTQLCLHADVVIWPLAYRIIALFLRLKHFERELTEAGVQEMVVELFRGKSITDGDFKVMFESIKTMYYDMNNTMRLIDVGAATAVWAMVTEFASTEDLLAGKNQLANSNLESVLQLLLTQKEFLKTVDNCVAIISQIAANWTLLLAEGENIGIDSTAVVNALQILHLVGVNVSMCHAHVFRSLFYCVKVDATKLGSASPIIRTLAMNLLEKLPGDHLRFRTLVEGLVPSQMYLLAGSERNSLPGSERQSLLEHFTEATEKFGKSELNKAFVSGKSKSAESVAVAVPILFESSKSPESKNWFKQFLLDHGGLEMLMNLVWRIEYGATNDERDKLIWYSAVLALNRLAVKGGLSKLDEMDDISMDQDEDVSVDQANAIDFWSFFKQNTKTVGDHGKQPEFVPRQLPDPFSQDAVTFSEPMNEPEIELNNEETTVIDPVKIKFVENEMQVSKEYLSKATPVFQAMFSHNFSENVTNAFDLSYTCTKDEFSVYLRHSVNNIKPVKSDPVADMNCLLRQRELCHYFMRPDLETDIDAEIQSRVGNNPQSFLALLKICEDTHRNNEKPLRIGNENCELFLLKYLLAGPLTMYDRCCLFKAVVHSAVSVRARNHIYSIIYQLF